MSEQPNPDKEEMSRKVMKRLEESIGEPITEAERVFNAVLEAEGGDGDAVSIACIAAQCKLLESLWALSSDPEREKEVLCSARINRVPWETE